jgi:hypothetical protein
MNPLDYLISKLEEVKKRSWDIPAYKGELKTSKLLYLDDNHRLVRNAETAAQDALFDEQGYVIRSAKHALMKHDYNLMFIEKDVEFGWRTLGIYFVVKDDYDGEEQEYHYVLLVENRNILRTIERFGTIKREEN